MKPKLYVILAMLAFAALPVRAGDQNCVITFDNQTSYQLWMKVDDHEGCTANPGMPCPSTEKGSCHTLRAMYGETKLAEEVVNDCDLVSFTYCVSDHNSCPADQNPN